MAAPEGPQVFEPIAPNPFYTGAPVRDPRLFFGRESDFAYARQRLIAERQGMVLLFVGERRSGKTSILFQIHAGRLGPAFLPIFVDMQQMAGVAQDREFLSRLAEATLEGTRDERLVPDYYDLSQGNPILAFDRLVGDVGQAFPDRRLLFLVDEAELLRDKVTRGELSEALLIYLASLLESRQVSFCLTGSPSLGDAQLAGWRHLLGKGEYREVGFLSRDDALRLIQTPVEGKVFYAAGVADAICRLTSGHPFYTQLICTHVVDYLNSVQRRTVGMEGLAEVIRLIVDNPPPQLVYAWDELGRQEQLVLSLAAEESGAEGLAVTPAQLRAAIERNHYPLSPRPETIPMALEGLFRRKVLDRTAAGTYCFRVDLFRQWIRRARSVWRLLEESAPPAGRRTRRALAAAAVAVVAAAAALWLWPALRPSAAARSAEGKAPVFGGLVVLSEPRQVEVWLDGALKVRGTTPLTLDSLAPGPRELVLRRPGYQPHQLTGMVQPGQVKPLPLVTLQRQTGRLSARSRPAAALVRVRGEKDTSGATPLAGVALPTGEYEVALSKPGYVGQARTVQVEAGAEALVDLDLPPAVGHLYLVSTPAQARLLVDQEAAAAPTPVLLRDLPAGPHRLRLEKDPYQTVDTTVTVGVGRTDTLVVALLLQPAILELTSTPAGAAIHLDGSGAAWGLTPAEVPLASGRHRVEVSLSGYEPVVLEDEYLPGGRYRPRLVLEAHLGTVRVLRPLFGTILIDGVVEKKVPPVDILLPVGPHRLMAAGSQRDTVVQVLRDSTVRAWLP